MLKRIREISQTVIADPIRKNLALTLLACGTVAILVGAIFGDWLDALALIPAGSGEALLRVGSAVLGAGVFAAIIKSAQFVDIFQNHVHNVFYDPVRIFGLENLKLKWISITQKILEATLPRSHNDVSHRIMEQFINTEHMYHFEGYESKYDVCIGQDDKIATIIYTVRTTLVISPNQEDPVFKQELLVDGDCKLRSLIINRKRVDIEGIMQSSETNSAERQFVLPLKQYAKESNRAGDNVVELERTYEVTQNIETEPYIMATIKRYSKGFILRAKIGGGYRFQFIRTGLENATDSNCTESYIDGEDFQRWILASAEQVLLPGQGYMLIILPE